jgi:hypothetical protein
MFAKAGITGPYSILEGEKGFCKTFAGPEVKLHVSPKIWAVSSICLTTASNHTAVVI